ncbi:hypothetical protein [Falsiroseomonas sp.]|uniref:hypothetical protein n=1 Tax=Falsiroseomonas sp. TaxID=2870721 RepID=UPI0035691896
MAHRRPGGMGLLWAASTLVPVLALLLATLVLGLHPERALRDPAAYLDYAPHVGFFSTIGGLGWWTAAIAGLLAGAVLRDRSPEAEPLLAGGLLSAVLGLDDLFMLHEEMLPRHAGLPETVVVGAYVLATLAYLWGGRRLHLSVAPSLLVAALGLFGVSVLVDQTHPAFLQGPEGMSILAEDGTKFAGICCWTAYHLRVAYRVLRDRTQSGAAAG